MNEGSASGSSSLSSAEIDHVEQVLLAQRLGDVLDAELFGDDARVVALVESPVLEPDGERLHPITVPRATHGGRRHQRRVDPPGQEDPHRHVGDELRFDRAFDPRPQLARQRLVVLCRRRPGGRHLPERARRLQPPALPAERVPGRKLLHRADDRVRRLDVVGEEVRRQPLRAERAVDPPVRQQRGQLGGEHQPARRQLGVVERLYPRAIAGQHQPLGAAVPDCESEHPVERRHAARPVLLVVVDDRLGVAAGAKAVPLPLQRRAQGLEVVDLAVVGDDDGAVLVPHRLHAAFDVDDRQPPVAERHPPGVGPGAGASLPGPLTVGAAVRDLAQHARQRGRVGLPRDEAGDAAHARASSF